ncbi:hypothetical protein K432DRAFT_383064 [Lepidopterella palustris CBS 459.81]|uniref:Transcription factor hoxa13 n=1 Tax=Lepidopterella palustris CBS 459.81 TaxID=1314670 RepID=A0A8E2E8L1_9PEZI|nr:hypothetical protein K432DRAFT_383064 [Lepidopterella palustris CBS 459.81]
MNGRSKKPKKEPNGHINGHVNGHTNSKMNGQVSRPAKLTKPVKPRGSLIGSLFSISARLLSWYLLITIIFRCPSSVSDLSESSPQACRPYLQARSYATPYVDPYYQAYLAPQVAKIRPHADRFNEKVYTPVAAFSKDKYDIYGAHRVEKAQAYLQEEWNKAIRPQLDVAKAKSKAQYDLYLAPHIKQTSAAVMPYYEKTKTAALDTFHQRLLPAYQAALPYAQKVYSQGHHITAHVIFPFVQSAQDSSFTFISRRVWPQLRVLYGANVEPQLVRIRERLGRYRDGKNMEAAVDAVDGSSSINSASSKFSSDSSSVVGTATQATEVMTTTSSAGPAEETWNDSEVREKIANDLRTWQAKFATAADKGAEDLEERVQEITSRQIESQVHGHGRALLIQLEETTKSTFEHLKSTIKQAVKKIPEDVTEQQLESAHEHLLENIRSAGIAIKDKAQALRTWRKKYDQETDSLVKAAITSTVAVLDNIQDLGLQEVGMRWAWMDGVTYKDWAKYHELKHTLEEWRNEVEAVGSRHEGLLQAHQESKMVEDEAMGIAADAAKELARLKEVAKWKIWAEDSTDDFSSKKVPARVFKVAEAVKENVEESASNVSESFIGSETPATESLVSAEKDKVGEVSSKLSESIIGTEPNVAEKAATAISEAVASSQATTDNFSSVESFKVEDVSSAGQSVVSAAKFKTDQIKSIVGTPAPPHESALSEASSSLSSVASIASETPKKVWSGAMAQRVEAKEIIYEDSIDDSDDMSYSEKIQSVVSEAGDRAADVTRAISEAILKPSSTQGTAESVTSLASEQYERALSAASSVLYGTEQGIVESMSSVASDKYAQAVTAASYAIYGTPKPALESLQGEASARYSGAVSLASEQYSIAKARVSEMVSGTPKPVHEEMLSSIEKAYSGSLSAASERLQVALQYTDTIKGYASSPSQGALESISSIAISKLSDGLSLASAQYTSAKIAAGAQPTPAHEDYMTEAQRRYYEGIGLAHARYSEFVDAASSAVYGTPTLAHQSAISAAQSVASSKATEAIYGTQQGTAESIASVILDSAASVASQASSSIIGSETPWTESVASQASQNWEAMVSKASEQVYGAPTPFIESVLFQAGAYGAQATEAAVARYAAVQALISDLVIGKEPDFTESVMSRLSSAYYTGYPAVASSASSYANENYETATSYAADAYSSASSVVSSIFTPPATLEAILESASERINAAVEAASVQVYGTTKGTVEQATEAAASAYSSVQSKASEAIYGTQPSYAEAAQASLADVAASAQSAISVALYGTPTGTIESMTSGAASIYSSISLVASEKASSAMSAAGENYEAARGQVSSAIYGPEQGAMESASSRLAAAIESARVKLSGMYEGAGETVGEGLEQAKSSIEEFASSVSSAVSAATERARDEL